MGKTSAAALGLAIASMMATTIGSTRVRAGGQATRVTFNKDIAPLVFDRCASCHQPGGLGPFSMLTYASVRQHATQMALLTRRRIMPPWKAVSDYGEFIGQHPLSEGEIDLIQRWVEQGAVEGDARDLPPSPKLTDGWELGHPDLVVTLEQPYVLPAEGTSVFRNFVIPVPIDRVRYVKGWEFHSGNARVVHHANVRIDRTAASRRLDEEDPAPGYEGLIPRSAVYPDGHFLAWTPGQVAPLLPKGLAWRLDPGTDLALEVHMYPDGRSEVVQPSIGLFFGSDPPERTPSMLRLGRQNIDIPAGETNYTITDSFVLPVDVEVQAVQPHAHYRAHDVLSTATLPDGTTKTLLHIADWDYGFQHLYRYVTPFPLPKGTTLTMRYTYDNSAGNPRNPDRPPQRVLWGPRSVDEMGHLGIQVFTKTDRDYDVLNAQMVKKVNAEDVIGYERVIQLEPTSVALHDDAAGLYLDLGQPDRAAAHFAESARLKPESAATHFNLGLALTLTARVDEAIVQYRRALAIAPDYVLAHNNLGSVLLRRGNVAEALQHLREAVRIDPSNAEAQNNLGLACREHGDVEEAIGHFRQAIQLRPRWASAIDDLAWTLATAREDSIRDSSLAVQLAEQAAELTGRRDPAALDVLAAAYAATGNFERAVATADLALQLGPPPLGRAAIRARQELYKQGKPYRRP
jgi:tetratricopeptide (TPR) repeat protein